MSKNRWVAVIVVIVLGFAAGMLFTIAMPSKNTKPPVISQNTNLNPTTKAPITIVEKKIEAKLSASPTTIKAAGPTADVQNNLDAIDKSTLKLLYKNNTDSELKGVKMSLSVSGKNQFGIVSSKNARRQVLPTGTAGRNMVFNIPDVKPGGTGLAELLFLAREPGTHRIQLEVTAEGGNKSISNPVTVTIN